MKQIDGITYEYEFGTGEKPLGKLTIDVATEYDGSQWIRHEDLAKLILFCRQIFDGEIREDSTIEERFL